jgi:uncharacterized protein YqeY
MGLKAQIDEAIKTAMKAKEQDTLRALRAIKSAILLAETAEGKMGELTAEDEIKLLTKAAKQRRDSAEIYTQQNREDLLKKELDELAIIEQFLPKPLSEEELKEKIAEMIARLGVTSAKEMGKVIGLANKELAGQADGKKISEVVKAMLG